MHRSAGFLPKVYTGFQHRVWVLRLFLSLWVSDSHLLTLQSSHFVQLEKEKTTHTMNISHFVQLLHYLIKLSTVPIFTEDIRRGVTLSAWKNVFLPRKGNLLREHLNVGDGSHMLEIFGTCKCWLAGKWVLVMGVQRWGIGVQSR